MLWGGVFETPSSEPLAGCQWDMAVIGADDATWSRADGSGYEPMPTQVQDGVAFANIDRFGVGFVATQGR